MVESSYHTVTASESKILKFSFENKNKFEVGIFYLNFANYK